MHTCETIQVYLCLCSDFVCNRTVRKNLLHVLCEPSANVYPLGSSLQDCATTSTADAFLCILFTGMQLLVELLPWVDGNIHWQTKQTLHCSVSLSCFFRFVQNPWKPFVGFVSPQIHKQCSVHALGKKNTSHIGTQTQINTNMGTR